MPGRRRPRWGLARRTVRRPRAPGRRGRARPGRPARGRPPRPPSPRPPTPPPLAESSIPAWQELSCRRQEGWGRGGCRPGTRRTCRPPGCRGSCGDGLQTDGEVLGGVDVDGEGDREGLALDELGVVVEPASVPARDGQLGVEAVGDVQPGRLALVLDRKSVV